MARRDGRRCSRSRGPARRSRSPRAPTSAPRCSCASSGAGASSSSSTTRPARRRRRRDRLGRVAREPGADRRPTGRRCARHARARRLRRDRLDARLPARARRGRRRRRPLGDEVPHRQPRRAARRDGHARPGADRAAARRCGADRARLRRRTRRRALLRGLDSLERRMRRITETATEIARRLDEHPAVERVRYPASRALISFDVANPRAVETRTQLIINATSLGGVNSTMESRHRWEGDRIPEACCASRSGSRTSTSSGPTSSRRSARRTIAASILAPCSSSQPPRCCWCVRRRGNREARTRRDAEGGLGPPAVLAPADLPGTKGEHPDGYGHDSNTVATYQRDFRGGKYGDTQPRDRRERPRPVRSPERRAAQLLTGAGARRSHPPTAGSRASSAGRSVTTGFKLTSFSVLRNEKFTLGPTRGTALAIRQLNQEPACCGPSSSSIRAPARRRHRRLQVGQPGRRGAAPRPSRLFRDLLPRPGAGKTILDITRPRALPPQQVRERAPGGAEARASSAIARAAGR